MPSARSSRSPISPERRVLVPQILAIQETPGNSVYTMAVETENGGNSGIDTIMRTLAEKRLIEDRAPTLDGSWMQRIMEARSANGNFLYSTMTPFSSSCGMAPEFTAMSAPGESRDWDGADAVFPSRFDKKLYLAVYYLGAGNCKPILPRPTAFSNVSSHKVTRDDLYYTWLANWRNGPAHRNGSCRDDAAMEQAQALGLPGCASKLLRMRGGCRCRSPCCRYAGTRSFHGRARFAGIDGSSGDRRPRRRLATMAFPSRTWFPKRSTAGALGSVRTGDWIHLDLVHGRTSGRPGTWPTQGFPAAYRKRPAESARPPKADP